MIGGMFLIFVLFLALGIPIAFSVGWATLSVHIMDCLLYTSRCV